MIYYNSTSSDFVLFDLLKRGRSFRGMYLVNGMVMERISQRKGNRLNFPSLLYQKLTGSGR